MPPTIPTVAPAERRLVHPYGGQVDARVARLADRDWGVLSVEELHECGLTDREIEVRSRMRQLHRRHRGVYAVGRAELALQGRFLAAVKACGPRAVLSHVAAAVLHGLFVWDHRSVDVTVAGEGTRLHAGVRAHRTSGFDVRDVTCVQGIPVTAAALTVLDCAATLDDPGARRLIREAQGKGLVELPALAEVRLRHRGRRGAGRLGDVISTGPAPTRSVLEDAVLDLLLHGGLAHPDVNEPLELGGRRVVPDFRWPGQRLIVEADGAAWHDHRLAREDDAERQALLEAHGERVLRVTWDQAMRRPAQTLTRLRAAGVPVA